MKRLFLHIGMPKTGSSAIQAFLKLNAENLKSKGYYYPGQQSFKQAFQTSSGNAHFLSILYKNKKLLEIESYFESVCCNDSTVIVSSEHLFKVFSSSPEYFFQPLAKFDFRIICYVRRQDNYLQSIINQKIKFHGSTKLRVVEEFNKYPDFTFGLLNALHFTDSKRIIVRPYELQQLHGGNIYSDFLNCMGIAWDDSFLLPDQYVNPSFDVDALMFRLFLNRIGFGRNEMKERINWNSRLQEFSISKSFGKPFQDHSLITPKQRITIIKKFEENNRLVARIFLGRKDESLFYDPEPEISSKFHDIKPLSLKMYNEIIQYIIRKDLNLVLDLYRFLKTEENLPELIESDKRNCIKAINKNLDRLQLEIISNEIKKGKNNSKRIQRELSERSICLSVDSRNFHEYTNHFSTHFASVEIHQNFISAFSSGKDPNFRLKPIKTKAGVPVWIQIVIEPPAQTNLQIFFQTDSEPFDSEQKSKKQLLTYGLNDVDILIDVSDFNGSIRIDPGSVEGEYKIFSIVVRTGKYNDSDGGIAFFRRKLMKLKW